MSPLDPLLDLLDRAMELQPAEREAFLNEQCAHDPDLLARALPLIQEEAQDTSTDWDLSSSRNLIAPVLEGPSFPLLGHQVGSWKLTRVLGEGGMGTVYLGERMDQAFSQEVAVKVIRAGISHDQTLDRFHQERQIQADLDHPTIASLIDAGHTESGQPYFVMEYIPGIRIDDHCETQDLGPKARIRIIQDVCAAVQYLHDRGIVHRDLKPSNLMVQPNGKTKLLDFGVAQVLNQVALTGKKPLPFVTPAYASPESLKDGSASPASDQYSLAVILHELLTDRRPVSRRSTQSPNQIDVFHVDLDKLQRGSLARLPARGQFMRGLQAILARAMHEDPSERYTRVEDFREDLGRLVQSQPVLALGQSKWQGLRQALLQHWFPIAASVLFIGILGSILVRTQNQVLLRRLALAQSEISRQASQEHANTMEHFAKEILLGLEGRLSLVPEASALRERSLAMGTAFFEQEDVNGQVPQRLLKTLLTSYWKLGLLRMASISQGATHIEAARAAFRKVLELGPLLAEQDPQTALTLIAMTEGDLGGLETDQLRLARGHGLILDALARFESRYDELTQTILGRAYLRTLINLAINELEAENLDAARQALEKFDREYTRAAAEEERQDPLFAGATRPLLCRAGSLWHALGEPAEAQRLLNLVLANNWQHPQDFRGSRLTSALGASRRIELEMSLQQPGPERGDLEAVEALLAKLDHDAPAEIGNPGSVAKLHVLRARMLVERSRRPEAIEAYERNFRILRYSLRQDPDNAARRDTLARSLLTCAQTFSKNGLPDERCESLVQEARAHLENLRQKGADHPGVLRLIHGIDSRH